LSLPVVLKRERNGSRENSRTICDLLRNVTRHRRRRHCRRRRRFISRVSFRRYCHSRPIKNARSHGRGVHIVESLNKGIYNRGDSRKKGPNRTVWVLFPEDVLFNFSMYLSLAARFRCFSMDSRGLSLK